MTSLTFEPIYPKTVLNKLKNNFKFCAKYQICYYYLQINAKKLFIGN